MLGGAVAVPAGGVVVVFLDGAVVVVGLSGAEVVVVLPGGSVESAITLSWVLNTFLESFNANLASWTAVPRS